MWGWAIVSEHPPVTGGFLRKPLPFLAFTADVPSASSATLAGGSGRPPPATQAGKWLFFGLDGLKNPLARLPAGGGALPPSRAPAARTR